jgi:hypothetical protein
VAAFVSTLMGSTNARGQGASNADCRPNPHLSRANQFFEDLQFDEAAQTLQRAIEYSNNCRWDLGEIYRLKGFVDAINGERERCHRDFEIFLAIDSNYKMEARVPPKIRSCFENANAIAPARRHLAIEHTVRKKVRPNTPIALRVKLSDRLRLIDKVQVFFRRKGVKAFTALTARADDEVMVIIPALSVPADAKPYAMEYIVRGVDRWGGIFVEQGNTRYPLELTVLSGEYGMSKLTKEWWFWGVVALGIAGLGAASFAAFSGDPDTVTLTITESGAQ